MSDSSRVTVIEALREDERRLALGHRWVRATVVSEAAVSFGVGTPSASPGRRRAAAVGLPLVDRSTGGTGILHLPGDVLWSVVLPRNDPRVGRDFVRSYARLGQGVVDGLAALGIDTRWLPAPSVASELCLLGPRGETLFAGGRVVGGAAQHATRSALLHHGSLSTRIDPALVQQIFDIAPSVTAERLTALEELGPVPGPETIARRVEEGLRSDLLGPGAE